LIETQFRLLTYLTMKAELKLLVRNKFMQFLGYRKKMTMRKMIWKVMEKVAAFETSVMIIMLLFLYSNSYQERGDCLTEILM
jgi:hypothetical protein